MLYHLNLILQYFVSGTQAIHPIMLPTSSRLVLMHYLNFRNHLFVLLYFNLVFLDKQIKESDAIRNETYRHLQLEAYILHVNKKCSIKM